MVHQNSIGPSGMAGVHRFYPLYLRGGVILVILDRADRECNRHELDSGQAYCGSRSHRRLETFQNRA